MLAFLELINSKISFLLFLTPLIFHCTIVEAVVSGAIFHPFVRTIIFLFLAGWNYELIIVCMGFLFSFFILRFSLILRLLSGFLFFSIFSFVLLVPLFAMLASST